jgi:hypothetical protein
VPVAHTYNLSYSGGRVQEDHSSKPAWANKQFRRPYLKNNHHKIGLAEWLRQRLPSKCEALRSNPSTAPHLPQKREEFLFCNTDYEVIN